MYKRSVKKDITNLVLKKKKIVIERAKKVDYMCASNMLLGDIYMYIHI